MQHQRNRCRGRGGAHGVIRQARQHIERLSEFGYPAQISLVHQRGAAADTAQQLQIVSARLARRGQVVGFSSTNPCSTRGSSSCVSSQIG